MRRWLAFELSPGEIFQLLLFLATVVFFGLMEATGLLTGAKIWSWQQWQPVMTGAANWQRQLAAPVISLDRGWWRYQYVQDLELRLNELTALRAQVDDLKQQLADLTKLNSQQVAGQANLTPAQIIGYGRPTIGLGTRQGISTGQLVFIASTLVGQVGQVSDDHAEILLWQSQPRIAILAKTKSGVTGIVSGNGRQVLLSELPADYQAEIGEAVLTSGQEGIPPGIFLGQVAAVVSDSAATTKTVKVDQMANFFEVSYVGVAK